VKENLTGISVEKVQELVGLLKQREALAKELSEIDAQIEAVAPNRLPLALVASGANRPWKSLNCSPRLPAV
jgi:hypothetical protein